MRRRHAKPHMERRTKPHMERHTKPRASILDLPLELLELVCAASNSLATAGRLRQTCTSWRKLDFFTIARRLPVEFFGALAYAGPVAKIGGISAAVKYVSGLRLPEEHFNAAFFCATERGSLVFFQAFDHLRKLDQVPATPRLLKSAAACGRINVIEYFLASSNCSCAWIGKAFRAAAAAGNSKSMAAIADLPGFVLDIVRAKNDQIFKVAIKRGHVGVLELLADRFAFGPAELKKYKYCVYDCPEEILEVLADKYKLTGADICSRKNTLLSECIKDGKTHTLEILASRYEATARDLTAEGGRPLRLAIRGASLEIWRVLVDKYKVTAATIHHDNDQLLVNIAQRNVLGLLEMLVDRFSLGVKDVCGKNNRIIYEAITYSSTEVLAYLVARFGPQFATLRYNGVNLTRARAKPELISLLATSYGLTEHDIHTRGIFEHAAKYAYVNVLTTLADCGFGAPDGSVSHALLMTVVRHGNAAVIEVLAERFGLSAAVVRDQNNAAVRLAARLGHANVLETLIVLFGLTAKDLCANNNEALRMAAACGQECVLEVLHAFGLGAADARACDNAALRKAAAFGNVGVLKMLRRLFLLTADDARAHGNEALRLAAEDGYVDVLKTLRTEFSLNTKDARARDNSALRNAATKGHFDCCYALVSLFSLTPVDIAACGLLIPC